MDNSVVKNIDALSKLDDIVLIISKGHFLVEEQLNQIIYYAFPHREKLSKSNFSFHDKAVLVNSITWNSSEHEIWDFIYSLDSLKNDFAIFPEPDIRNKMIKNCVQTTIVLYSDDEGNKKNEKISLNFQVVMAIGAILGFLSDTIPLVAKQYTMFFKLLKEQDNSIHN